jgi:hypothetical protein
MMLGMCAAVSSLRRGPAFNGRRKSRRHWASRPQVGIAHAAPKRGAVRGIGIDPLFLVATRACIQQAPQVPTPRGVGIDPSFLVVFLGDPGGSERINSTSPIYPYSAQGE